MPNFTVSQAVDDLLRSANDSAIVTGLGLFIPIGASLQKSITQTITNSGPTLVTFASARWDDNTFYDNTNSSLKFLTAGRYEITASVQGLNTDWRIRLYKNGVEFMSLVRDGGTSPVKMGFAVLALAANDYIQLYAEQYANATADINANDTTYLETHRIK